MSASWFLTGPKLPLARLAEPAAEHERRKAPVHDDAAVVTAAQLADLAARTDALRAQVEQLRRNLARGEIERRELLGQLDDARKAVSTLRDARDAERARNADLFAKLQVLRATTRAPELGGRPTGRIARRGERRALAGRRAADADADLSATRS